MQEKGIVLTPYLD